MQQKRRRRKIPEKSTKPKRTVVRDNDVRSDIGKLKEALPQLKYQI